MKQRSQYCALFYKLLILKLRRPLVLLVTLFTGALLALVFPEDVCTPPSNSLEIRSELRLPHPIILVLGLDLHLHLHDHPRA